MLTRQATRGQALVEFALVFPVFMLLLFGLIDIGRFVYTDSALSQAAREGARLAAVEARWLGSNDPSCVASASQITPSRPGAKVCPADATALKADVAAAVNRMVAGLGQVTTLYLSCNAGGVGDLAPTGEWDETSVRFPSCGPDRTGAGALTPNGSGQLVSVRVVYEYGPITPIVASIVGSVSRTASATMLIN